MVDIKVPALGESVTEAIIAKWFKAVGDAVAKDEMLVELETDKVTLEVSAEVSGVLKEIKAQEGDNVEVGALLGVIEEGAVANVAVVASAPPAPVEAPVAEVPKTAPPVEVPSSSPPSEQVPSPAAASGPAVRKMIVENDVNAAALEGSGKGGRLTKGDVLNAIESAMAGSDDDVIAPREERVKMTKLRKAIARRLKESQNTAAILTTFNEVDMTDIMKLRSEVQEDFIKKHDVKLGFMSLFTKSAIAALKELPAVNAEIDGDDLVYKNHYDIGMAVGTPQGLVVPVIRNADRLSFAGIEKEIIRMAKVARDGKLSMADMTGGTFTITNGGIYGSMLSTPIINPPQAGILGLHNIVERPMVVNGEITIRRMMYLALSYDHRVIDGREAVTFLVKVKQAIENPSRLLFEL